MAGKGSTPRAVDGPTYRDNYERTFAAIATGRLARQFREVFRAVKEHEDAERSGNAEGNE